MHFFNQRFYLIALCFFSLLGHAQQRWHIDFGNPNKNESSRCTYESYDKGYLTAGTYINEHGLLYKSSKNGDLIWYKTLTDGANIVSFYAVCEYSEGKSVVVGSNDNNPLIFSLNNCGELSWCNTLINPAQYAGGSFVDVLLMEDGNILALGYLGNVDLEAELYLFLFRSDGGLIWMNKYASVEEHSDLYYPLPFVLDTIATSILISGDCYYRLPDDPDVFVLRPMFIKLNADFNEEWLLPYGHNISWDVITGLARGVIRENDSIYKGFGHDYVGEALNGILMDFSLEGQETSHFRISNDSLDDGLTDNYMKSLVPIDDTLLMSSTIVSYNYPELQMGEYIIDRSGKVVDFQSHPISTPAFHPMIKTDSLQFVFSGNIQKDGQWDFYLYKLNNDLSSAPVVTDTITYDYLCNDLPIASDTIDLSSCGIITDIGEIPGPDEYFAGINNITISAHPNPASSRINFKIEKSSTSNIKLQVYNTSGKMMRIKPVKTISRTWEVNIFEWPPGLYIATAISKDGKNGNVKFIVN